MAEIFEERLVLDETMASSLIYDEHLVRYELAKSYSQGKVVLDVACGSGYGSYLLADKAEKVWAIDINQEALALAEKKYQHPKIKFLADDVEILSKVGDKMIDLAVSFETIEHLKNPDNYLEQLKRVLKTDGLALISTPNRQVFGQKNPWHLREYTKEDFSQILAKYFKNVVILEQFNALASVIGDSTDGRVLVGKNKQALYFVALASDVEINLPKNSFVSLNESALIKRDNNPAWRFINKFYSYLNKFGFFKK